MTSVRQLGSLGRRSLPKIKIFNVRLRGKRSSVVGMAVGAGSVGAAVAVGASDVGRGVAEAAGGERGGAVAGEANATTAGAACAMAAGA